MIFAIKGKFRLSGLGFGKLCGDKPHEEATESGKEWEKRYDVSERTTWILRNKETKQKEPCQCAKNMPSRSQVSNDGVKQ